MISTRKIYALCEKQFKTIFYNLFILSGLVVVPIVAFFFGLNADYPEPALVDMLVTMNILMNGANIMCVMIAEEKEKNTLNVLIASTVSGLDFLISKLLVTVLFTLAINAALFFIMDAHYFFDFGSYMLVTGIAILPPAAIGAVIGLLCKTQSAATTAITPFMMALLFVPMFVPADSAIHDFMQYVFSEQMTLGLRAIYNGEAFLAHIGFIAANFAVFFVIFWVFYRKKGLAG